MNGRVPPFPQVVSERIQGQIYRNRITTQGGQCIDWLFT